MKPLNANRKRILRIRPGLLANFSGGAGYMPFIMFMTVPISAIAALIGHLVLYGSSKGVLHNSVPGSPIDLAKLHKLVRWHTTVCLAISLIAIVISTVSGNQMVYGDKLTYLPATLLICGGPFIAWVASTFFLGFLLVRRGPKWYWPIAALAAHILCVAAIVWAGLMLS